MYQDREPKKVQYRTTCFKKRKKRKKKSAPLFAIIHYLVSFTRAPNGSHLLKLQDFRVTQMGI